MPHIIVKLYAGRSDAQKQDLTDRIVKSVVDAIDLDEKTISVAFEEFEPEEWAQAVYKKDILEGPGRLFKAPGYNPFSEAAEKTKQDETPSLMAYVRGAAELAAREDSSPMFNPMSWLDTELEENPQSFDPFFDTPWDRLSDHEKGERAAAVRRVL